MPRGLPRPARGRDRPVGEPIRPGDGAAAALGSGDPDRAAGLGGFKATPGRVRVRQCLSV